MKLKDFVKDVALNLKRSNVDDFKQRAASLSMDVDTMSAEELLGVFNSVKTYDGALNLFDGDTKKLTISLKKVMKETETFLSFAKEYYFINKKGFSWFNKLTKTWIANPLFIDIKDMSNKVVEYWLENKASLIYVNTNDTNHFQEVLDSNDKALIKKVINHKNFKFIPSIFPFIRLLTDIDFRTILTQKEFDKVFNQLIELIGKTSIVNLNNGNPEEFEEELASIIEHPLLTLNHISSMTVEQQVSIFEYIKRNKVKLDDKILRFFYEITGDDYLLPEEAKEVFLF